MCSSVRRQSSPNSFQSTKIPIRDWNPYSEGNTDGIESASNQLKSLSGIEILLLFLASVGAFFQSTKIPIRDWNEAFER